ncbi:MAG: hypothetical protein ACOWW1_10290 [archaeon]
MIYKRFRCDDDLCDKLVKTAQKQGISENQLITDSIRHYLVCNKQPQAPTLKQIIAKYQSTCKKCGSTIHIGSIAFWSKETIICMDCYVQALGDKALANKYLKMRELSKVIKHLKSQADQYADTINNVQTQVRFSEFTIKANHFIDVCESYFDNFDDATLKEAYQFAKQLSREWEDLKMIVSAKFDPIKKRL